MVGLLREKKRWFALVDFCREPAGDTDMPDGTARKLVDISRLNELGLTASIGLREGIADTYRWYLDNIAVTAEP